MLALFRVGQLGLFFLCAVTLSRSKAREIVQHREILSNGVSSINDFLVTLSMKNINIQVSVAFGYEILPNKVNISSKKTHIPLLNLALLNVVSISPNTSLYRAHVYLLGNLDKFVS